MGSMYKSFMKKYGRSSILKNSPIMQEIRQEMRKESRKSTKLKKKISMDEDMLYEILSEIDEYVPEGVGKSYWQLSQNKPQRPFKERFTKFIVNSRIRMEQKANVEMSDRQKIEHRGRMSVILQYEMLVDAIQDREEKEFLCLFWWHTNDILQQTLQEQRKPAVIKSGVVQWQIKTEIQGIINALNVIKYKMRGLVNILWKKEDLEFLKEKPIVPLHLLVKQKKEGVE